MTRFGWALAALLASPAYATTHAPAAASAPGTVVVARSGQETVSAAAVAAMVAALPPADRAALKADPARLQAILRDRLLQDRLLADAIAAGWDKRPDVAAEADRARQAVVLRRYILGQLPPAPAPTDAQVTAAYDAAKSRLMLPRQFHLAQIFVAVPADAAPAAVEQAHQRLVKLRASLAANPDGFAAAARANSADRSASSGGDLGWLREDVLADPFKATVQGMQEGAISDPQRTPDGWHLIRLIATRPAGPAPLDQVRASLVQAIAQQQQQAATRVFFDSVLKAHPVEIDAPALAKLSAAP